MLLFYKILLFSLHSKVLMKWTTFLWCHGLLEWMVVLNKSNLYSKLNIIQRECKTITLVASLLLSEAIETKVKQMARQEVSPPGPWSCQFLFSFQEKLQLSDIGNGRKISRGRLPPIVQCITFLLFLRFFVRTSSYPYLVNVIKGRKDIPCRLLVMSFSVQVFLKGFRLNVALSICCFLFCGI